MDSCYYGEDKLFVGLMNRRLRKDKQRFLKTWAKDFLKRHDTIY